ncbi:MAG TPA: MFS transporter [Streptosporangiaceae bacterium]|jgi:putative MFS transporter
MDHRSALLSARLDRLPIWPYRRAVFLVVGIGYFFAYFDIGNIGYALPRVLEDLQADKAAAAFVLSGGLWGYIAGGAVNAVVSDRLGRRAGLLAGALMYGVGSLGTALAGDMTFFGIARFVSGMGIGATLAVFSTYVSEIAPADRRGRYISLVALPAMIGTATVPFISLVLLPTFTWGWRVLLVIPAAGTVAFALAFKLLPESPRWLAVTGRADEAEAVIAAAEERVRRTTGAELPPVPEIPETAPEDAKDRSILVIFKRPVFRWTLLFFVLWFVLYIGDYGFLGLGVTLITEHGFDLKHSIQMTLGSSAGLIIGSVLAPYIADRFPRKYVGALFAFIAALGWAWVAFQPEVVPIAVMYFLYQLKIGAAQSQMYLLTAEHFPTRGRTAGVSLANGGGHVGGAIAPFVLLFMLDHFGFGSVWATIAAASALVAILTLLARDTTGVSLESVSKGGDAKPAGVSRV